MDDIIDHKPAVIILRCSECNLPWAKLHNGYLIVESRHHGQKHTNIIAIDTLVMLSNRNRSQVFPNDRPMADQAIENYKRQVQIKLT